MNDKLNGAQPQIVSQAQIVLENALEKVKAGKVVSIAVIDVLAQQGAINISFCGPQLNEIYLGSSLLGDMIKEAIKNPKKQSGLLRPLVGLPGGPGL